MDDCVLPGQTGCIWPLTWENVCFEYILHPLLSGHYRHKPTHESTHESTHAGYSGWAAWSTRSTSGPRMVWTHQASITSPLIGWAGEGELQAGLAHGASGAG